ncbi:hypothetical protein O9G_000918 [Rozella allomycis CSF55]|uniref:IFT81 calponin homology domain-containing protein n=1 Tax=Rozella allomycis (strain CSF55) TaxID=988480 RepID=A0A075ARW0_ROZAC|nr:hypothetical protein O9G_000918 [Rozella allomycis CSF55]|eukprot:EPZ31273.1 hypothetical protein O9G_000918 [Rozella allomycis CSF55]
MVKEADNIVYEIQDLLSQPPYSKSLSFIQLQQDLPFYELINLVGDVIATIDSTQRFNLNSKSQGEDEIVTKLLDFLQIGRYPEDPLYLRDELLAANRDCVFKILKFILSNTENLKTRCYLAQFLTPLFLPQELQQDGDVWLEAARNFRIAKHSLTSNERKIEDLKNKTKNIKNEIESSKIKLETLKKINSGSSEAILEDLRREVKMSTYLIEDTYPKELQTLKIKIKASQQVIDNPLNFESEWDLLPLQKELETLQQKLNQINQAKAFENEQQASMAAAKKAARADELIQLSKDEEQLSKAAQTKSDLLPKGLKDFVAELRVKSNDYKSKKTLLAAMASEVSILERTEQVLQNEKSVLDQQYQSLNLTRTSHDKALLGELSKVLDEIQNETNHLLTKKSDLGSIKNNFSQLSSNYKAKKKAFDLAMAHLERFQNFYRQM